MLEPTGLRAEAIGNGIKPAHGALVEVLSRHLTICGGRDDLYRLAFAIVGMRIKPMLTRDVIDSIRPQLLQMRHGCRLRPRGRARR
jgi:TetR/AcrR family transcriptional regulator, regulator of cefoperazone and chloramphenicol sensitivity